MTEKMHAVFAMHVCAMSSTSNKSYSSRQCWYYWRHHFTRACTPLLVFLLNLCHIHPWSLSEFLSLNLEYGMTAFQGHVTVDGENIWSTLFALYTGILMNKLDSVVGTHCDELLFCVFILIAINSMNSDPTNWQNDINRKFFCACWRLIQLVPLILLRKIHWDLGMDE